MIDTEAEKRLKEHNRIMEATLERNIKVLELLVAAGFLTERKIQQAHDLLDAVEPDNE